jgi:septum formation protein
MGMPTIILASNSPRRRELLGWTGWTFQVSPVDIDETPLPGEAPGVYVSRLARAKAEAGASLAQAQSGCLILAADTIVADGTRLLGKPSGPDEAVEMLVKLRGRSHQVYTAIHLISTGDGLTTADLCCANVPMRAYTTDEISAYVNTGDPLDKAGAYAIQHAGFHPVENFHGCYACVVGLPLCHLTRSMVRLGFSPLNDVPAACQANLNYQCPVFAAVLRGEDVG